MSLVAGPFERIVSQADAWSLEQFFKPDMDRVADASLKRGGSASLPVAGASIDFHADGSATHQLELVWPRDDEDAVADLAPFNVRLQAQEVGLRLRLHGTATAKAGTHVPAGSLAIGFGVEGGATVEFERFRPYPLNTPIRTAIEDIVRGLRLPSDATTPQTLPATNEVLTTRLTGYLQLSADVAWTGSLAGTRGVRVGELALAFESRFALTATAAARYRVAGAFEIHACRSGDRARFVVRKQRDDTVAVTGDFILDGAFETGGLPATAPDLIGAVLGGDVARVLRTIDGMQSLQSLADLEAAVGNWAADAVGDLAQPLIGRVLDEASAGEFLSALRRVAAQYTSLDARVARLYQDAIDDVPGLGRALDTLASATGPEALTRVSDSRAWAVFRTLAGERFHDALLDRTEYEGVLSAVTRAREFVANGSPELKQVIATLQHQLPFDGAVRRLQEVSSPDALRGLADRQLQKAVSILLDRAFDRIQADAEPAFARLQDALKACDAFNARWYGTLLDTANRKFKATVNSEFLRASSQEALVDVEIDVDTPEGQRLAGRAAVGDFADLLASPRAPGVTLRTGVLTHTVTRQSHLQVNLLGFTASEVGRLIAASGDRFQQTEGGLLLVHTIEATNEREVRRRNEETLTRFVFRGTFEGLASAADATRTQMVDTMRSVTTSYDYRIDDSKTSVDELIDYLGFAQRMRLVDDPAAFVGRLQAELPQGWTRVKAEYVIRYDVAAVAAVFSQETGPLQAEAQDALAAMIGRVLIVPGKPNDARLGLAYLNPTVRAAFARATPSVPPGTISVAVPAWVTRDKPRTESLTREQKELLRGVLNVEARYLERLGRLDRVMDRLLQRPSDIRRGPLTSELDDVITDFVAMADDFPTDRTVNPFFAAFDALIAKRSPRARKAALVLEITPNSGGDVVTKYLSA